MQKIRLSSRSKARLAGVFELLEGGSAAFGQVAVMGQLVVSGAAAATATNILSHQSLIWLGFALAILGVIFHLAWAFLMYELLKIVNKSVALFSVFVVLACCAMQAVTTLFYLAPLMILQGGAGLSGFAPAESQALAYAFVKLSNSAFDIDLVLFGLWCVLTGYLIVRSTFLPRIFGILLIIDGLGWMLYLHPPLAIGMFTTIASASALAEIPLPLWLIIFGLNEERWNAQKNATQP